MMRTRTVAAFLAILSAAAGCSGGGSTSPVIPPPGTPNSVVITNDAFTPTTLGTTVGSTVTWTWNTCSGVTGGYSSGPSCVTHNVTFDDGISNAASQSGGTASRKFTTAGTYPYHCTIHGAAMSGQVVVQ